MIFGYAFVIIAGIPIALSFNVPSSSPTPSLPNEQRSNVHRNIVRRLFEEVKSQSLPRQETVEITSQELNEHNEYVNKIIDEETAKVDVIKETANNDKNTTESVVRSDKNNFKETQGIIKIESNSTRQPRDVKDILIPVRILQDDENIFNNQSPPAQFQLTRRSFDSKNANESTTNIKESTKYSKSQKIHIIKQIPIKPKEGAQKNSTTLSDVRADSFTNSTTTSNEDPAKAKVKAPSHDRVSSKVGATILRDDTKLLKADNKSSTGDATSLTVDPTSSAVDATSSTVDATSSTVDNMSSVEDTTSFTIDTTSFTIDTTSFTIDTTSFVEDITSSVEDTTSSTADATSTVNITSLRLDNMPSIEDTTSFTIDTTSFVEDTTSFAEDTTSFVEDTTSSTVDTSSSVKDITLSEGNNMQSNAENTLSTANTTISIADTTTPILDTTTSMAVTTTSIPETTESSEDIVMSIDDLNDVSLKLHGTVSVLDTSSLTTETVSSTDKNTSSIILKPNKESSRILLSQNIHTFLAPVPPSLPSTKETTSPEFLISRKMVLENKQEYKIVSSTETPLTQMLTSAVNRLVKNSPQLKTTVEYSTIPDVDKTSLTMLASGTVHREDETDNPPPLEVYEVDPENPFTPMNPQIDVEQPEEKEASSDKEANGHKEDYDSKLTVQINDLVFNNVPNNVLLYNYDAKKNKNNSESLSRIDHKEAVPHNEDKKLNNLVRSILNESFSSSKKSNDIPIYNYARKNASDDEVLTFFANAENDGNILRQSNADFMDFDSNIVKGEGLKMEANTKLRSEFPEYQMNFQTYYDTIPESHTERQNVYINPNDYWDVDYYFGRTAQNVESGNEESKIDITSFIKNETPSSDNGKKRLSKLIAAMLPESIINDDYDDIQETELEMKAKYLTNNNLLSIVPYYLSASGDHLPNNFMSKNKGVETTTLKPDYVVYDDYIDNYRPTNLRDDTRPPWSHKNGHKVSFDNAEHILHNMKLFGYLDENLPSYKELLGKDFVATNSDELILENTYPRYPTKKKTAKSKASYSLRNLKKSNDHNNIETYLNVLRDMIQLDNVALKNFDWLASTVDIRAGVEKLIDLLKNELNNIHPLDRGLLNYVKFIFYKASRELESAEYFGPDQFEKGTEHLQQVTDTVQRALQYLRKSPLPRGNRKKKHRKNAITALNDALEYLLRMNRTEEDNSEELEEFLTNVLSKLENLHRPIQYISLVSNFRSENWYDNLKDLYLTPDSHRKNQEVLLHLLMSRIIDLIEAAAQNGAEVNLKTYLGTVDKRIIPIEELKLVMSLLKCMAD